jgi:hypothetical protein
MGLKSDYLSNYKEDGYVEVRPDTEEHCISVTSPDPDKSDDRCLIKITQAHNVIFKGTFWELINAIKASSHGV